VNNKIIILILAVIFLAIAVPRILFPDLDHGDEWADAENLISGENFYKFGFLKTHFLPFFGIQDETLSTPYTHYPPLANIISGIVKKVTRSDSLYPFRAVALFFSFFNLLFWYLFIKRFSQSNMFAWLCGIFYVSNPFFIFGIDALSQISYADFLRSLILFIFIVTIQTQGLRKRLLLIFLWILFLLESLMTIEYLVYLSLFIVLFKYFFKIGKEKFSWKHIFLLFSASLTGFLLHFLKNVWYFGSVTTALRDFKNIVFQRISSSTDSPFPLTLATWWQYVIAKNFSLVFLYNYFILSLALFFFYLLYQELSPRTKKEIKHPFRLLILLAICGVNWYVLFPSHALAHTYIYFLVRHLLPVASLGFAIFFYYAFIAIRKNGRYKILRFTVCLLCMGIVVFTGVTQSELPVNAENIASTKDFIKFKQLLVQLRSEQVKGIVAVNYWRTPFISYYTRRKTIPIFDAASLKELPSLPRYFIFLYRNNSPAAVELFETLKQQYDLLFTSESRRFPGVIFVLKE
jgi:hypothetical protein